MALAQSASKQSNPREARSSSQPIILFRGHLSTNLLTCWVHSYSYSYSQLTNIWRMRFVIVFILDSQRMGPQGRFSRGILKGDSQGGFSKDGFSRKDSQGWILKGWILNCRWPAGRRPAGGRLGPGPALGPPGTLATGRPVAGRSAAGN